MNRNAKYPFAFAAAAAALFLAGTPVFASDADDQIEAAFEKTYVYQTYLKEDSVNTAARNGEVTLSGTVAEESHKALAAETAAGLPGVTSVINQLATTAEVAAEDADTSIRRKVTLALVFHRNVDAGNTTVAVKDGVVTLSGEADSIAQKELTAEYASDIEGVTAVQNEMTVATTPPVAERTDGQKMDDASISAQVKSALRTHRSTSAMNTKVQTRDGTVTLTGIAANAAEKALVTKLVTDIQGVTSVNNQMTINEVAKAE